MINEVAHLTSIDKGEKPQIEIRDFQNNCISLKSIIYSQLLVTRKKGIGTVQRLLPPDLNSASTFFQVTGLLNVAKLTMIITTTSKCYVSELRNSVCV